MKGWRERGSRREGREGAEGGNGRARGNNGRDYTGESKGRMRGVRGQWVVCGTVAALIN